MLADMEKEELDLYKAIIRSYEDRSGIIAPAIISISAYLYTKYRLNCRMSHRDAINKIRSSLGYNMPDEEDTLFEQAYNTTRINS